MQNRDSKHKTGKKNSKEKDRSSKKKDSGKSKPKEKSSAKKKTSQEKIPVVNVVKANKVIDCHITNMKLTLCPNSNCMWSDKNGGCLYRRGMEPEDLGTEKGISGKVVATQVRKGKSEIIRFTILDSYIEFAKEYLARKAKGKTARKIRKDSKIKELVETSKIYRILQSHFLVDNFIVSQLCDEKLYSEFAKRLGIKPPNVVTLTGIRELYQGRLRERISEIKKTRRGKHKSKRRKGDKVKQNEHRKHERHEKQDNQVA